MTIEQVFDSISVRFKQEDAGGLRTAVNWAFTDVGEKWVLGVSNRTLWYVRGRHDTEASVTVTMTRATFISIVTQETTFMEQIESGAITLDGDASALLSVFGNLDVPAPSFPIVEP